MAPRYKDYMAKYYREHSEKIKEQARFNGKRKRAQVKTYIRQHLSTHPCVDCGEADPIVLEFDHRDRATKVFLISDAWNLALSRVIAEIEKCDVRCANCHRRKTMRYREFTKRPKRDWLIVSSNRI